MKVQKETKAMRKERIALSGATREKVVPNKKAYTRKPKHRKGDE